MTCELCLKPLGSSHGNRRYCSDSCRARTAVVRSYGLSPEDYRILLNKRKCVICGRNMRRPHVDHDHKTNEVYGVICARCNTHVLAHMGHGKLALQRAEALVQYLQNPPARALGGRFVK